MQAVSKMQPTVATNESEGFCEREIKCESYSRRDETSPGTLTVMHTSWHAAAGRWFVCNSLFGFGLVACASI